MKSINEEIEVKKDNNKKLFKVRPDELKDLHKLFTKELKEIYWIEGAQKKVLHKMHKYACGLLLVDEISRQLDVVKDHRLRIEEIFSTMDEDSDTSKSATMEGLIDGAEFLMSEFRKGVIRDAGIILAAYKMKHFMIASYGSLCFYARILGNGNATSLLNASIDEEKLANEKLSRLIESIRLESVNESAVDSRMEKIEN